MSGKAALLDLGLGIGIAVGPAVVGRTVAGGNVSVLGTTTNLAARLQTAAEAGEIVLSDEAHRAGGSMARRARPSGGLAGARAQEVRRATAGLAASCRNNAVTVPAVPADPDQASPRKLGEGRESTALA